MAEKYKMKGSVASAPAKEPVKKLDNMPPSVNSSMRSSMASSAMKEEEPAGDLCMQHKRKIEIICIDCKERICSQCALFGPHKPHDIRMEQDVLDEISIRTECLMEMFQIVEQTAAEKPDEAMVESIEQ